MASPIRPFILSARRYRVRGPLDSVSREESRDDPQVLRISLDTKAKVPIGPFSRRGRARGKSEHVQVRKLVIELDYILPYHGKHNPIERCWSALERH